MMTKMAKVFAKELGAEIEKSIRSGTQTIAVAINETANKSTEKVSSVIGESVAKRAEAGSQDAMLGYKGNKYNARMTFASGFVSGLLSALGSIYAADILGSGSSGR